MAKKELGITPAALGALAKGDFENAAVALTPGGIEAQEAQGQKDLVNSDTIPVKCSGCEYADLEKIGIKFLELISDVKVRGDLFVKVELPPGWKKVATDHSMHSNLVDDKDRVRANIFYKAAFYDRSAHINLVRRFNWEVSPEDLWESDADVEKLKWAGVVLDGKKVIFHTEWKLFKDRLERINAEEEMRKEALSWLNKNYPGWENYSAYWD